MSTSCVLRSGFTSITRTAGILGQVSAAPPSERELDAYREEADRFIAELDEEAYLHLSGQKETYDLTPIYERHAELFTLEAAQKLGGAANGFRSRELWRVASPGVPREPTPGQAG